MIIDWTDNKYFSAFRAFIFTTSGGAFRQVIVKATKIVQEVRDTKFIQWLPAIGFIKYEALTKFISFSTIPKIVPLNVRNGLVSSTKFNNIIHRSGDHKFILTKEVKKILVVDKTPRIVQEIEGINIINDSIIPKVVRA